MHPKGLTRTIQSILKNVEPPDMSGVDFPTRFALQRFAKKFEVPRSGLAEVRRDRTFQQWVEFDSFLNFKCTLLPINWVKARLVIHKMMGSFRFGELSITNGSASTPTCGQNSVGRKLIDQPWECSPDCFDLFAKLAGSDHAFRRAAKFRLKQQIGLYAYRGLVQRIYRIRQRRDDVVKAIFAHVCVEREASRFSTVPKNNEIDRSIDLQPFCNMVTQRSIGLGLRKLIKEYYGLDLDRTQELHGDMIASDQWATVDLKNASDSVSWRLVEYLFPAWFVRTLRASCPPYTEGLDGHFYMTNKVSSMGNGFTFELMTLILLTVVRLLDRHGSVFGDDIIISREVAPTLVSDLRAVGFVVNDQKSFLDGPFRESCGKNYHDDYGYIESYDFMWPSNLTECISFINKCYALRRIKFFNELYEKLAVVMPRKFRGPMPHRTKTSEPRSFAQFVRLGVHPGDDGIEDSFIWFDGQMETAPSLLVDRAGAYQWPKVYIHKGWQYVSRVDIPKKSHLTRSDRQLLLQYLHAGRRSEMTITGSGQWQEVTYLSNGHSSVRVKAVVTE